MIDGTTASDGRKQSDATTYCRCWNLVRRDGRKFSFTDHDATLTFGGSTFVPTEAPTARAVEQTTGLAVDNSEALGALSDSGLTEQDILAGRFDGAKVEIWRVDWSDPDDRAILFRGEIGEIERSGGAFKAELRGLTEALNQPQGRLYQRSCRAVLGDRECGVDLKDSSFSVELALMAAPAGTVLRLPRISKPTGWFDRGTVEVIDGTAAGDRRMIKADREISDGRRIDLWEAFPPEIVVGTRIRLLAGCDKSVAICRAKFDNVVNHRGFPFLPSEDWLYAYPKSGETS
jgi:uncharacterized phage protein (TIGR02218 family)